MAGRGGGGYASGKNALAICQRCSKQIPYKELVYDGQYPDMRVCRDCWDPKHPQEYLPDTFDPITLYDPTGDPDRAQANIQTISFPPFTPGKFIPDASDDGDPYGGGPEGFDVVEPQFPLQIAATVNQTKYNFVTGGGALSEPPSLYLLVGSNESPPVDESTYGVSLAFTGGGTPPAYDATPPSPMSGFNGALEFFGTLNPAGDSSYVTATSGNFQFGASDFTVEFWLYADSAAPAASEAFLVGNNLVRNANNGNWSLRMVTLGSLKWELRVRAQSTSVLSSVDDAITPDQWNHVALVREGDAVTVYVGGVVVISNSNIFSGVNFNETEDGVMNFGGAAHATAAESEASLLGHIDEIRVTGSAVYTEAFTPPSSPFERP